MGLKKKKNVIILSVCMILCFTVYQLYFFFKITSVTGNVSQVIQVLDHKKTKDFVYVRSENDKFINENGLFKGVFYSHIKEYRPNSKNEFKCRSSEQVIPFDQVNDDYCDCDDGTDEPSTSACPSGIFYCDTQRKNLILTVPSSKVNDGICDCCDGSDEWIHDNLKKLLSQSSKQHYRHFVDKCPNICS